MSLKEGFISGSNFQVPSRKSAVSCSAKLATSRLERVTANSTARTISSCVIPQPWRASIAVRRRSNTSAGLSPCALMPRKGTVASIHAVALSKSLAPTMLICLILANAPSSILKFMPTRLRSSGVTVVVISTPYLPRVRYWRLSSCSALSSRARSKIRPSAMPISLSALTITSFSNSFIPTKSICAMAGRSCTTTTMTPPSTSIRTSLKKPVAKSALIDAAAFSSVSVSPTLTGR